MELLKAARDTNVDIVFESSTAVAYDPVRPVIHPDAVAQCAAPVNAVEMYKSPDLTEYESHIVLSKISACFHHLFSLC